MRLANIGVARKPSSTGDNQMHCTNCGTNIPDGAAFCPKCGQAVGQTSSPQPSQAATPPEVPKKKLSKGAGCLLGGVGIILLLALIGQCVPDPNTNSTTATNGEGTVNLAASSDATDPADLPLAVTATELFNAYDNNEASAQGYFGDRPLLVSGTVEKVTLDFMDDPVVGLRTPNQFMSAQAALAEDAKGQASNFNPGDKVKLLCENISEVAGIPMLKDCRTAPAGQKSQPVKWADDK